MAQKSSVMKPFLKKVEDWILPHLCCLCGQETGHSQDLCSICRTMLPWAIDRCYRCGLAIDYNQGVICQSCIECPPTFDRMCTLFSYDAPVTQLITGLKFGRQLAYGRLLGEILADAVLAEWYQNTPLPTAVIPMPLHRKRLQKRGYNQALELLWATVKRSNIKLLAEVVERVRSTKPQSGLNAEQRQHNMSRAFNVKNLVGIQHVAVMDDVVTTGNTVNALCRVLKNAGVEQIDVWCICRA